MDSFEGMYSTVGVEGEEGSDVCNYRGISSQSPMKILEFQTLRVLLGHFLAELDHLLAGNFRWCKFSH